MRTRDGHNIPNDTRDMQFLIETGIRGPDVQVNRCDVSAIPEANTARAHLYHDQAITFYSAAQGKGKITDSTYGRRGQENFKSSRTFSTPIEYTYKSEKE
eukprot:TRINITY_DN3811_c0_g1_i10.p1 TRINITY_DN3811_c0_g1~~TRINITY_DN3811_c0_g1_i10.p1  ORF type:complete len:100 (-),score=5.11 TRINITY_DN3811_c0_g1_i10:253-552(-)